MGIQAYFLILIVVIYGIILQSEACPIQCACSDTRVDCYSRRLQNIPNDIPESVTILDLQDNEIREVDVKSLSHLSNLETMSLQNNYLTELKSLTFVNLTKLKKLHIGNNYIEKIDHNVFANLPSLQDLDLTNNNITEITGKLNISSLQRLFLGNNQITSLQDNTLNGVRNIHYLILANNNISYISKSALDGMTHLSNLVLRGNPIKIVDNIFRDIEMLSYLDVSSCHLTNIPQGLPWALRYLKISDNNLTMIGSRDLYSTRYLGVITLDNNHIQAIHDGALLYTPYLTEFRISHNKMMRLPQIPKHIEIFTVDNNEIQQLFQYNFAHDSAMKVLSLSNNQIGEISANTFSRLANLSTLLLDHNDIKYLRNMTFANLRQLITLNLEFNPIKKIEQRAFGGLQKLEQLKLANIETNETVIEGVIFQDIPTLHNLDLQGSPSIINDILNSSDLLRSLRNIQYLNLMNCSLETLSMEIKTSLPNLKSLKLADNPWQCDSALTELHNWINDSPKLFGNLRITCASPAHLRGRHIQDINIHELMLASMLTTSDMLENIVEKMTIYENDAESTVEGYIRYMTLLSQVSTMVSSTQVLKIENFKEISLPVEQDTASVHILTTDQLYSLNSEHYFKHRASAVANAVTPLSDMTTVLSASQLFPSTTVFESLPKFATPTSTKGVVASSLKLVSSMSKVTSTTIYNIADTSSCVTMINSSPSMQLQTTSTTEEASTTRITHYSTSTLHSTSTINSQSITKILTKVSTLLPTSVIFITLPDAAQPQTRKLYQTSSTMIPPLISLPSIYGTSNATFSITQSNSKYFNSKNTPSISAPTSNIITTPEIPLTPQTFLPVETAVTSSILQINTMKMRVLPSSKIETPESITVRGLPSTEVLERTEVQQTIQKILHTHNQSVVTNITDFERKNQGYTVKPDNRLPTFSSSSDTKLRAIIIIVSISLLALVIGLFIVIIVRHCKNRKYIFLAEQVPESQANISDTVFIISHMAGEQSDNLNTETVRENVSSASSKDSSGDRNSSTPTKKSGKFNRKSLSASAVISKSSFNCMRDQTEDDSELLVYSWK